MTLGPRSETAGVMDSVPSLPIHSSILFVVIAGLFLAALIIRARRLPLQPRRRVSLTVRQARLSRRRIRRRQSRRRRRGDVGSGRHHQQNNTLGAEVITLAREGTMSRNSQPSAASAGARSGDRQFRIYWGRTLLALIGLLALLAGVGTTVAASVTTLAWTVPAICGAVLLVSLVTLQVSAAVRRRARRARIERAMQEAMSPNPEVREETTARQRSAADAGLELGITSGAPFDALSSDTAGQGGPDSLVKLDEDGLPDDAGRLFGVESAAQEQTAKQTSALFDQTAEVSTESWEPREVPHPKYLVAEKAERPEPEQIQAPEAPAPQAETKLKQPAAPAAQPGHQAEEPAAGQSIDLDAVLKRRRA